MVVMRVLEARWGGGRGALFVVEMMPYVLPKLSATLNPHSLTSYPPLAPIDM